MTITKDQSLDKAEAITILKGFLEVFQKSCNQLKTPLFAEFERFLSKDFKIFSNGRLIASHLNEYLARIDRFENRYTHCEVSVFKEDTLICDHRVVCHYKADLTTKGGEKVQLFMMAIATIEDHKIVEWKQVVHERGSEKWEV